MELRSLTAADLAKFEGKGPDFFCNTGLITPAQNHCAHFVCHAINLQVGRPLCGDMTFKTRHRGVTMRVDDVFNYCIVEGFFDKDGEIPGVMKGMNAFFIIATVEGNLMNAGGAIVMHDNPHKHIGICIGEDVWNFSNSNHYVVRDTIATFFTKMRHAYGKHTKFLYAYRQDI